MEFKHDPNKKLEHKNIREGDENEVLHGRKNNWKGKKYTWKEKWLFKKQN